MLFLGALGIAVGIFLSPLVVSAAKFIADSPHFGNFARAGGAVTAVIIAPCLPYVFLGFAVTIVTRFSANSRATRPVLALALSLCIAIIAVHALSPLAEITRMSMGYKGPVQSNFRMGFAIFNSVFGIPIMLVLAATLGSDVAALIRRRTPQNSCGKIQP